MTSVKKQDRYGNFISLSYIAKDILMPIFLKYGIYDSKLLSNWEDIVGADLFAKTIPYKITSYQTKTQTKKILHLLVYNYSDALILDYQKNIILEKIMSFFGKQFIHEIKIIQNPSIRPPDFTYLQEQDVKENKIDCKIEGIDDKDITLLLNEIAKNIEHVEK